MKGKEVKIGLSIIGLLLCVFGTVLFVRLRSPDQDAQAAAKNAAKNSQANPKQNADGKDQDAGASEPSKGKPNQESEPKGGPSLGLKSGGSRYSSRKSEQEPEKFAVRDAWPNSTKSQPSASRYPSGMTTPDEEASAGDRYNRRDDAADLLQIGGSPGRIASGAEDSAVEDELPAAASDAGENGSSAPAEELAGGEPADGYPARDELLPEELPSQAAANDPFPSAARPESSTRGLPIAGRGELETTGGEMELAPSGQTGSPRAGYAANPDLSDAAVEAEVEAAAREMRRGNGHANSPSGARPGFSSVSRRSEAFAQPSDDASSDDAARGVSPVDREAGGAMTEDRPQSDGVYFVEANDSFASISKKVYGTEGYFKALHEYNRERYPNPDLIDAGDEIATPEVAVLEQTYPKLCPKRRKQPSEAREGAMRLASSANSARRGRTYLVANGDTLFDIAKRELGKASRWREIYDLNQDALGDDFNFLSPGMELLLPASGERPDPVADRRTYDRRR